MRTHTCRPCGLVWYSMPKKELQYKMDETSWTPSTFSLFSLSKYVYLVDVPSGQGDEKTRGEMRFVHIRFQS